MRWYFEREDAGEKIDRLALLPARGTRLRRLVLVFAVVVFLVALAEMHEHLLRARTSPWGLVGVVFWLWMAGYWVWMYLQAARTERHLDSRSPRVTALALGDADITVQALDSRHMTVPLTNIRQVRTGRASELYGPGGGPADETQIVLAQPINGFEAFSVDLGLKGYAAAVVALRRLVGNPPAPETMLGRRVAFPWGWIGRWTTLGFLVVLVAETVWERLVAPIGFSAAGAAVGIVLAFLAAAFFWLALPWQVSLADEGLRVRYALWTRRLPWGEVSSLEETGVGRYMVRGAGRSITLDGRSASPLPDLIATIAHYANLPIPDPSEERPEGV